MRARIDPELKPYLRRAAHAFEAFAPTAAQTRELMRSCHGFLGETLQVPVPSYCRGLAT